MNGKKKSTEVQQQILLGFGHMAQSRIAICGLARDCKKSLAKLVPSLEQLGEQFATYEIIVVENDSIDGTGEFLTSWRSRNPKVNVVQFSLCPWMKTCKQDAGTGNWWFSKARMERMNFARNLYLDALDDNDSLDYVIVVDLDILTFSLPGIAHTFGLKTPWDFIASNGTRYSLRHPFRKQIYWDTYVYEPENGFADDVLRVKDILAAQNHLSKILSEPELFPVKSAFGGLCIYRRDSLGRHRYSIVNNSDSEVKVLCDHTTLHRSMANTGNNKAFISPFQTVRYETFANMARRLLKKS